MACGEMSRASVAELPHHSGSSHPVHMTSSALPMRPISVGRSCVHWRRVRLSDVFLADFWQGLISPWDRPCEAAVNVAPL
jgi:hypothetical protein